MFVGATALGRPRFSFCALRIPTGVFLLEKGCPFSLYGNLPQGFALAGRALLFFARPKKK